MTNTSENDETMPSWAAEVCAAVVELIEGKGAAAMESRFSAASDNSWGLDLIEIAPAVMLIPGDEGGANEEGYGLIHSFDLLGLQRVFSDVTALSFGLENDGRPCLTLEGSYSGHVVVLRILSEPHEDAELSVELSDGGVPVL